MSGVKFGSAGGQRGMYGSFGTTDVRNTLIMGGPSFCSSTVVANPTGNVDVAPTVVYLLGPSMPQADGRILNETLLDPTNPTAPSVKASTANPVPPAAGLGFEVPTDSTGATKDAALAQGSYTISLAVKNPSINGKTYRYFDYAKAVRQ